MSLLKVDIAAITLKAEQNKRILTDIKFSLDKSKIYSIIGSNGSGKTTLLLSIANLINKNLFTISGGAYFNNSEIFALNTSVLNMMRLVFQNPSSMFDPLRKLKYYIERSNDKELLKNLFSESLLPDISITAQKYIYEFSEGQAQRIAICMAIADHPKLLILDEPTSSLDTLNINLISIMIRKFINETNSVLIVTHDYDFAWSISDYAGKIENGTFTNFIKVNAE